jgi:hypothetical protein
MKSAMVEEMAVVNRLIDLHIVLTHILPEASSMASTSVSIEDIGISKVYGGSHPATIVE